MGDSKTAWSIGDYTVRLIRQDELEGGTVLHFVVAKSVATQKEGFKLFKAGGRKPHARDAQSPASQGGAEGAQPKADPEGVVIVKYSRLDPVSREALVGVYVGRAPEKGVTAQEYKGYMEVALDQAVRLAVEESKRLGLN